MPRTFSVLALGTRDDAVRFRDGSASLGHTQGVDIRASEPTMDQLVSVFGRSDEWLFLGSHFAVSANGEPHMFNRHPGPPTVDVTFKSDRIRIARGAQTRELVRAAGFEQHRRIQVVFWGGCDVCGPEATVRVMRDLFGPHLLLGWRSTTGWQILHSIMGGYGTSPPNANPHFFGRIQASSSAAAIREAWLRCGAETDWGVPDKKSHFSAVDPDGKEWIIRDDGSIVRGRTF